MKRQRSIQQLYYDHRQSTLCAVDDGPLKGLRHRTVIDRETGADSLALWQEEHLPGFHVPLHRHDCEEVIAVVEGVIDATIGENVFRVSAQGSVLIPFWCPHGFEVVGDTPVRLHAIFSSSNPRIFQLDGTPSTPPWQGGGSDHLEAASRHEP